MLIVQQDSTRDHAVYTVCRATVMACESRSVYGYILCAMLYTHGRMP